MARGGLCLKRAHPCQLLLARAGSHGGPPPWPMIPPPRNTDNASIHMGGLLQRIHDGPPQGHL